jgi:hypothetical protein
MYAVSAWPIDGLSSAFLSIITVAGMAGARNIYPHDV